MPPDDPLQRPGKAFGNGFTGIRPVGIFFRVDYVLHFDPIFQWPTDSGRANHQHRDLILKGQKRYRLVSACGAPKKVDKHTLGPGVLIREGCEFASLGQDLFDHFELTLFCKDFLSGPFTET